MAACGSVVGFFRKAIGSREAVDVVAEANHIERRPAPADGLRFVPCARCVNLARKDGHSQRRDDAIGEGGGEGGAQSGWKQGRGWCRGGRRSGVGWWAEGVNSRVEEQGGSQRGVYSDLLHLINTSLAASLGSPPRVRR